MKKYRINLYRLKILLGISTLFLILSIVLQILSPAPNGNSMDILVSSFVSIAILGVMLALIVSKSKSYIAIDNKILKSVFGSDIRTMRITHITEMRSSHLRTIVLDNRGNSIFFNKLHMTKKDYNSLREDIHTIIEKNHS